MKGEFDIRAPKSKSLQKVHSNASEGLFGGKKKLIIKR